MAPAFRYRYVDIGTTFTGDSRMRDAQSGADRPAILYSNELACDVGGTCWGANEPLAIIDHHLSHEARFPSASAAVLHKADLIREKFAQQSDVVWLVTHREPDFDGFCSMYLARWLIEDPSAAAIDWQTYGLHPDAWRDVAGAGSIDWLAPDFTGVPTEHRWPLLLAAYVSMLEMRRHIACPRERALRSVLYAALKRGRDYLNPTSGATEFFDEVRAILQERQLNPAFDSVLEGDARFTPELAMLDREADAYNVDLKRARRALVYLPESEAPSADFFQNPKKSALKPDSPEVSPEHLLLADTFRIATDGIYLRDPECGLFREWARLDLENSVLGSGFEFTAIAYSNRRPAGAVNRTEYVFSIDPERANGRHLYTVWSRLQTEEVEALRVGRKEATAALATSRAGDSPVQRPGTLEALLSDPWSGGQSQSSTVVTTPRRGTLIGPAGARSDLRDDPVAEAVRTDLENPIYTPASLIAGPRVTIFDFAAVRNQNDAEQRHFDLNLPTKIPPPEPTYFRLASIGLRSDVPIGAGGTYGERLAGQIGDTLWQVLYPETPGKTPENLQRHLVVRADWVGLWSDRGVAAAEKQDSQAGADGAARLRHFAAIVSFARDIDGLAAEWNSLEARIDASQNERNRISPPSPVQEIVAFGEELARRALELQQTVTMADAEVLRRFCDAIGFERLVARLRDLNQVAAEHLRRDELAEQARRTEKRTEQVARIQRKVKRLQVLLLGFVALAVVGLILRYAGLSASQEETLALFGSPVVLALAARLLQPGKRKLAAAQQPADSFDWILLVAGVVWLAAWATEVLRLWKQ